MTKSIWIKLNTYTFDEACERLAQLTGHTKNYSRGGFYKIIKKLAPDMLKPMITESDLQFLADQIRKPGRPKKR